jgi:hypothetical protein
VDTNGGLVTVSRVSGLPSWLAEYARDEADFHPVRMQGSTPIRALALLLEQTRINYANWTRHNEQVAEQEKQKEFQEVADNWDEHPRS